MQINKAIDLIFTQWQASLRSKDRSKENVRPNFEELFDKWRQVGATFDDLYEAWLPKAIKAHLPAPSVARSVFKQLKSVMGSKMDKNEKEFVDEWNKSIESIATESFFEFFPALSLDEDTEPKVYGNMSHKEYTLQRKYADSFPTIDTSELKKIWKQQQYNTNVDDLMVNISGDPDEANK